MMTLAGLWRYPVKSLGGQALGEALLTSDGLDGDRRVHVRDAGGAVSGRIHHGLLTVPGSTDEHGTPLVDGHRWDSPEALSRVRSVSSPEVELAWYDGPERFDIGNLLVATDGAVEAFGYGVRRLRPNLLIEGVLDETSWPGQALAIGDALIGLHSVRQRCIVTTIDPDTGAQNLKVLRHLRQEFGNAMALNAWVIRPGRVRVGDEVQLVATDALPRDLGGWIVGAPYTAL